MGFIREYISQEDTQKYGFTSTWTIDRERGVFLIASGVGREGLREFKMFNLEGDLIVSVNAEESSRYKIPENKNPADGIIISIKVYDFFMPNQSKNDESRILLMLKEAIIQKLSGSPNQNYNNVEVEVIF